MNKKTKKRNAVAGNGSAPRTADPGPNGSGDTPVNDRAYNFPNSKKIYVNGKLHREIRVPFREIALAPTKSITGEIEINESVSVYDTSGPWGDPDFHGDVTQGLPPLRAKWIRDRGDVEEYEGRNVQPIDDGWLSEAHAAHASRKRPTPNAQRSTSNSESGNGASSNSALDLRRSAFGVSQKALRASANHPVTQLWYARQGIITPEMEFIAIRENRRSGCEPDSAGRSDDCRSNQYDLRLQHSGSEPFGNWQSAIGESHHSGLCARGSRARSRNHPREHQSSGMRADDHRPQFSGKNQRQHRQQRRRVVDRGRSRKNALGHQMGRRHSDGSEHRQEHSCHARMDHSQLACAHRHGADLSGAGESRRPRRGADMGNLSRHVN